MTRHDSGLYSAKHPRDTRLDETIAQALREKSRDKRIRCAAAFEIAKRLGISPYEVGVAIDLLEIRIEKCQLGLFGYEKGAKEVAPAEDVSPALSQAIIESLENGRLPCKSAWDLAARFKLSKMDVSAACDRLAIKISKCQIGSF